MTWPVQSRNNMLNGQTYGQASLHTGFPGTTGANEVVGGAPAYGRKTVAMNTSTGGTRSLNAAVTFYVPAITVRFIGVWNGADFVGYAANGGATPKNFMSSTINSQIHCVGHDYQDGQTVVFIWGTPPGGLTAGTTYFVRNRTAETFKVATTFEGATINFSSGPSDGCWMCAIREDVYAGPGTHGLDTASIVFPS